MKRIIDENFPCWYELSFRRGEPPSIILRVRDDIIAALRPVPADASIVTYVEHKHSLPFRASFAGDFGFDGCMKKIAGRNGFSEFLISIPTVAKKDGRCSDCKGKHDEFDYCYSCSGKGYRVIYDYSAAYRISESLSVASLILSFPESETTCPLPQLFTFGLGTGHGMGRRGIYGEFSCAFVEYLGSLGSCAFPTVSRIMHEVFDWMAGPSSLYEDRDFPAVVYEGGRLHFSCPGNACGLDPDRFSRDGEGYGYSPHNMDNPIQQFTLLAGLAAMHDFARESMKA